MACPGDVLTLDSANLDLSKLAAHRWKQGRSLVIFPSGIQPHQLSPGEMKILGLKALPCCPCLKTWFWQSYSVFLVRRLWCWLRYGCPQFGELGFNRPTLCNIVRKRETLYVPALADDLVLKTMLIELLSINSFVVSVLMHISSVICPSDSS